MEQHLEQEQEFQVNKLMKKIKKMENETISKQLTLEQVRLLWQSKNVSASSSSVEQHIPDLLCSVMATVYDARNSPSLILPIEY